MTAAEYLAATARVFGPPAHTLRGTIRDAAEAFAARCTNLDSTQAADAALGAAEGLRRHLLMLRARLIETEGAR
jgi:hypothetical protein